MAELDRKFQSPSSRLSACPTLPSAWTIFHRAEFVFKVDEMIEFVGGRLSSKCHRQLANVVDVSDSQWEECRRRRRASGLLAMIN